MAFWNTTSGVVTGVAGTLTGLVGIATLATQMGWVGSDGGSEGAAATTTAPGPDVAEDTDDRLGETRAGRVGSDAAPGSPPEFAVAPVSVHFAALGARSATVTVRNTGDVEVTVDDVSVDGADEDRFTVAAAPCTSAALDPGRSCEVEVAVAPQGGDARATMIVEVAGAPAQEVPLTAAAIL